MWPLLVEVYRNLHKDCYSLRDPKVHRVINHQTALCLTDVTFIVQVGGQTRVRRTRRKNVHAFLRGEAQPYIDPPPDAVRIYYNPYLTDTFVCEGAPITHVAQVWLDPEFNLWAVPRIP